MGKEASMASKVTYFASWSIPLKSPRNQLSELVHHDGGHRGTHLTSMSCVLQLTFQRLLRSKNVPLWPSSGCTNSESFSNNGWHTVELIRITTSLGWPSFGFNFYLLLYIVKLIEKVNHPKDVVILMNSTVQATFPKELWVLEDIWGHNFLGRNMYLHLIVIIGVDNNICNLQLPPKPIIPWERWLVCHPKLLNLLFQGTMCLGGHWRSQFLLLAQITTMKCLSRSFCQENCAICHIFFTLPFRGHWGQTLFPYDLHHDAMIQKAGS